MVIRQLTAQSNNDDEAFLLRLAEEIHSEWRHHSAEIQLEQLHPCFISSTAHLITRKGLKKEFPEAFNTLSSIAHKYGVRVLEDRRNSIKPVQKEQRRKIVLTVGLVLGMSLKSPAFAEANFSSNTPSHPEQQIQTAALSTPFEHQLNLSTHLIATKSNNGKVRIGKRKSQLSHEKKKFIDAIRSCFQKNSTQLKPCLIPDVQTVSEMENILFERLNTTDPALHKAIIHDIAYYYAQYPEVIDLLKSLANLNWTLNIQRHTWQARAKIKYGRVEAVDVYFDPQTAAQMLNIRSCTKNPICTVSPADALLHELLHTYIMLNEPEHFARENAHKLYPFKHEHETIKMENRLYSKMSAVDGLPRPNRQKHQARLVAVKCPVCI